MRMSIVDGAAFVDFSSAGSLNLYTGHKLIITDSAGKKLTGYIKAVGTGETYGGEIIVNETMELDSNWTDQGVPATNERSNVQAHGGTYSRHLVADAAGKGVKSDDLAVISGVLYKFSGYGFVVSGALNFDPYQSFLGGLTFGLINTTGAWVNKVWYPVCDTTGNDKIWFHNALGAVEAYADDFSFKQVLTPSVTGVTIVSTHRGTTYNWAEEEAGFNRNDSAGYTYAIYSVSPAWLVATAEERNASGFWCDANGFCLTADTESYNKSRWW